MPEEIKFNVGDKIIYTFQWEIVCREVSRIEASAEGVKIYDEEPGFMWQQNVDSACRNNVDMFAQKLIDKIKKNSKEIKDEYCEELKDTRCDCDNCQEVMMPEPPCTCCFCKR